VRRESSKLRAELRAHLRFGSLCFYTHARGVICSGAAKIGNGRLAAFYWPLAFYVL